MKRNNNSFTIVEILVVLAIVGVLIGLSVVGIQQIQKSTRSSKENSSVVQIKTHLESYYNEYRHYPTPSMIKFDSDANAIYICTESATSCTSSTSTGVFSVVKIEQAGVTSIDNYAQSNGTYSEAPVCNQDLSLGVINEEVWRVFYGVVNSSSTKPQGYYLATCTEIGWKDFSENPLGDGEVIPTNSGDTSAVVNISFPSVSSSSLSSKPNIFSVTSSTYTKPISNSSATSSSCVCLPKQQCFCVYSSAEYSTSPF
ncbi:MAG: type II secretion system protein [bacterium]